MAKTPENTGGENTPETPNKTAIEIVQGDDKRILKAEKTIAKLESENAANAGIIADLKSTVEGLIKPAAPAHNAGQGEPDLIDEVNNLLGI